MKTLLFPLPGNEAMARSLATLAGGELGTIETRAFPDGETYLRYELSVRGCIVILVATLDRPNEKILPLLFAAETARELGASKVILVAPYLCYLRQDQRFKEGEAVTSHVFAQWISKSVDGLVTVDPHLHRLKSLSNVYGVPTELVSASGCIADWIATHISAPLLIGPDEESEQWVAEIAARTKTPYLVLRKIRQGERKVEVSIPDMTVWGDRTPVLVDDIISTGVTMISALRQLRSAGFPNVSCVAVHGVFAESSYREIKAAGAERVVTTNTIAHPTGTIDISSTLAATLSKLLHQL